MGEKNSADQCAQSVVETMITSHPKFAVVGHPNKGKSSIVSALAMDDSVQISDTPGTTTKQRSFPLRVDGKTIYELFDTPGFQRARALLGWLEGHDVSADKRAEVVRAFMREHREDPRFGDELALLDPIMDGAGIIYVVDASKPYGKEYEAEMEILRWTGQPSMALLNHIGTSDYAEDWNRALTQYFKMVRRFDPMVSETKQHIFILESMAQLKEEWIEPIKQSIAFFETYQEQMLVRSAGKIAKLLQTSLSMIEKRSLSTAEVSQEDKEELEEQYKEHLRQLEEETYHHIEGIWHHASLEKEEPLLVLEEMDLFSDEIASLFGLTRKELVIAGATSGAATGAGIDLLFAGHTLLIGGAIGAIVGSASAYFGFDELSDIKLLGQSLGKRTLEMGPMKNRNFPYILLGRALYHTLIVSTRSHAKRNVAEIKIDSHFKERWLSDEIKKSLEAYHKQFRAKGMVEIESVEAYTKIVLEVLEGLQATR